MLSYEVSPWLWKGFLWVTSFAMNSPARRRSAFNGIAVAIVLLIGLLSAYVGAYYALVTINDEPHAVGFVYGEAEAEYRIGGAAAAFIFQPVHTVDRKLRPHVWTFEPPMIQYP